MARLSYPLEIIDFFAAMLRERKTKLSFDDFTSLPLDIGQRYWPCLLYHSFRDVIPKERLRL